MDSTLLDLAEKQIALCRVVGNSRRLVILWLLSQNELSVNEIAQCVGSTLQNISQHLKLLRKSGIVTTRRDGQMIYYRIADNEFIRKCPAILQVPDAVEKIY